MPHDTKDTESLGTRLLAVFLCIPLFELSLYLGLVVALGSPRLAAYTWISFPFQLHLVLSGVALLVALVLGMSGITWLLGHLFLTHGESRRSLPVTAILWGVLAATTAVAMASN